MSTTPTIYRRHNCDRQHRTYRTLAKCIWPRAVWFLGEGPFAVVAYCKATTVSLHNDLAAAQSALGVIDGGGCGGRCSKHHKLIRLEPAHQADRQAA